MHIYQKKFSFEVSLTFDTYLKIDELSSIDLNL